MNSSGDRLVGPDGNPIYGKTSPPAKVARLGKTAIISFLAILAALAAAVTNLDTILSKLSTYQKAVPPRVVQFDRLRQVEVGLIPTLSTGPAEHNSLLEYYQNENPEIFDRLDTLKNSVLSGDLRAGATYVAGAQGAGKSHLFGKLGNENVAKIVLCDKCKHSSPDLQSTDGKKLFSSLPSATDSELDELLANIEKSGKKLVFIDGLDEVSNDTAERFLAKIELKIRNNSEPSQHFLVFGRPEGFWGWLSNDRNTRPANTTPSPLVLKPPRIRSIGDINYRCDEFYQFQFKQNQAPPEFKKDMSNLLETFSFLKYTIGPPAVTNFVMQVSLARIQRTKQEPTIEEVKQGLFSDLLKRNTDSHTRPAQDDDIYLELLERAAIYPIEHNRPIDAEGFFEVLETDFIQFDDYGTARRVRLRELLNRSGLIFLDPSELSRTQYRFEPFWVQMHLIEKWNKRNHPNHVYRG